MPRKVKYKQCSSFTAALCIHSGHFLLCPSSFIPPRLLPLQTLRQRARYLHHWHTQLELVMALTDFSNTVIQPPWSKLMHYVPPNFIHFVAGSCWILKLYSSLKCTRHFQKFLHSKHTIFSCIPPCHVSSHVYLFKLFSCFKV